MNYFYETSKYLRTYSREQKHVSDTPMLLIEIDSISNMGCQKKTFLFVVRRS